MRVAVLCSGTVLQPTLHALASQNLLVGLGVPDRMPEIHMGLEQAIRQRGIPFVRVTADDLAGQLAAWIEASSPDVVCTMGFPFKIPESILEMPQLGFFNFHGGALPGYRGPDPVFWQIKNLEPNGAVTIHRIAPELDTGGVAHAEPVPIDPDDTYGLHMQRLGAVLPRVMIEFVQQLAIRGRDVPLNTQSVSKARYWKRPEAKDLNVDWAADAAATQALVRACNPLYGGAITRLQGVPIRLLQVTRGDPFDPHGASPGTIVEASSDRGLRAACGQGQTLLLDIAYAEDGFFTGQKLVKIFTLKAGDQLL